MKFSTPNILLGVAAANAALLAWGVTSGVATTLSVGLNVFGAGFALTASVFWRRQRARLIDSVATLATQTVIGAVLETADEMGALVHSVHALPEVTARLKSRLPSRELGRVNVTDTDAVMAYMERLHKVAAEIAREVINERIATR